MSAGSVRVCLVVHHQGRRGGGTEPNLLGRDLREQAEIERWNRRMELELFAAIGRTVQNTSPIFQGRFSRHAVIAVEASRRSG